MAAGAVIVLVFVCLIPIAAIFASAVKNMKERDALHKERLKAIEMGQTELPRALLDTTEEVKPKRPKSTAVHGLVWTGIGLGLLVSSYSLHDEALGSDFQNFLIFLKIWAFPSLFVGLGLLAYALMNRNGNGKLPAPPSAH